MSGPGAAHFLALEQILIDRLREVLPPNVHVLSAADLAAATEATQPTPAVHVLYRTYRRGNPKPAGRVETVQDWLTVVAVRNLRSLGNGEQARDEAGPLLAQVIDALDRYQPGAGYGSLALADAPPAGYRAGHGYFPLGWRVSMKLTARPGPRSN